LDAQLLVHNFRDRLHGLAVKDHPFFEPVSALWEDIASLKCPPLPRLAAGQLNHEASPVSNPEAKSAESADRNGNPEDTACGPSSSEADPQLSSDANQLVVNTINTVDINNVSEQGLPDRPGEGPDEDDQTSPKSSRGHEALWLRRTMTINRSNEERESDSAANREEVVPDYILPWITGVRVQLTENTNTTSNVRNDDRVADGFTGDAVSPRPFCNPSHRNSREGSPSPSLSSPSSYSSTSSEPGGETDDELLLAVENYRRLEELLASGSYFTEHPTRDESPSPHNVDSHKSARIDNTSSHRVRISGVSPFSPLHPTAPPESDVDISGLVLSDAFWRAFLQGDRQEVTWSFEDEITMAVLDAMDHRHQPTVEERNEFEFGVIEEPPRAGIRVSVMPTLKRQKRKQSIRKTFEKVKRRFLTKTL
jgi:hypothetical protein